MKRIILHWAVTGYKATADARKHYHFIVEGDGRVVNGDLPPEANRSTQDGEYAAHTKNCNTDSIGVAFAAMMGAKERPFSAGSHPITPEQVKAMVRLCADLCTRYRIPVTRETVLSHAEVQPTLKIAQAGKWDIAWLPGMDAPADPVKVGDHLRGLIAGLMEAPKPTPPFKPVQPAAPPQTEPNRPSGLAAALTAAAVALTAAVANWWDGITDFIRSIFGG